MDLENPRKEGGRKEAAEKRELAPASTVEAKGAFKAPEGRATRRRLAGQTSSVSSASSVPGEAEPGPSTSDQEKPILGLKRKAEPYKKAPLKGAEPRPTSAGSSPLSREGVRDVLEGWDACQEEDLDADRALEEVNKCLTALESFRIVPTYRGNDGVPLGEVGLVRSGIRRMGTAISHLYDVALNTGVGEKEKEICRLHREVDKLRGEVNRMRTEIRSLREEGLGASGASPARGDKDRGGDFPPLPSKPGGGPKRTRSRRGDEAGSTSRPCPPPQTVENFPPLSREGEWKKAERRKRRKAGRPPEGDAPPATKSVKDRKAAPPKKAEQPKRRKARAAPQTAAVTITATGERSYADIMKAARDGVCLAEIGITDMTLKRARNGGFLLEIPGTDGPDKADRLARDLEEVLYGDAVVARPVKSAELRITGLDDSVSLQEMERAICAVGECTRSSLRMGNIRRAPNGLGAVWVRCPLAAARRLERAGRLEVGWTHAVVRLLEERPLQCYRCLMWGHAAAACKGQHDRSGRCFNCGGADHVARDCTARSRCPVCDVAGEQADHRMGGPSCATLKRVVGRKAVPPVTRGSKVPPVKGGNKVPPVKGGNKAGKKEGKGGGGALCPPLQELPPAAARAVRRAQRLQAVTAVPTGREEPPPSGPGEELPAGEEGLSPEYGDIPPSQDRGEGVIVIEDDDPSQVPPGLQLGDWDASP